MHYLLHPISLSGGILLCVIWAVYGARCDGDRPTVGAYLMTAIATIGTITFALLLLFA